MDVFVVRVYRHPQKQEREMVGYVEIIGDDDDNIRQFASLDELMEIFANGSRCNLTERKPAITETRDSTTASKGAAHPSRDMHEGRP